MSKKIAVREVVLFFVGKPEIDERPRGGGTVVPPDPCRPSDAGLKARRYIYTLQEKICSAF